MLRAKLLAALGKNVRVEQVPGRLLTMRSELKASGLFTPLHPNRGMSTTPLLAAAQHGCAAQPTMALSTLLLPVHA
jgi:hypothetical protein